MTHLRLAFQILSLSLSLTFMEGQAQVNGIVTSQANGKPVAGADVFINKTSISSMTDEFGQFQLEKIPTGITEIVAYKKGSQLYRAPMRIQEGRSYNLKLELAPEQKKVKGKSNPEAMAQFKSELLGEVPIPSHITLLNENQIQIKTENNQYLLMSPGPIQVDYPLLGYRINCYLSSTSFVDLRDAALRYEEQIGTNINQNIAFERQRLRLFQGSLRHWYMSLVAGRTTKEGFSMEDTQKLPVNDSSLVTAAASPGYYKVKLDRPIIVKYKKSQLEIVESTLSASSTVDVNKLGIMINPKIVHVEGNMETNGLATQLPLDYKPLAGDVESSFAEALKHFYEKVYAHTDKPYYYPGEPLWFKVYLNYYHADWRDSLSTVLHMEIISSEQKVVLQKMLKIENGVAHGDFILPDSMKEGYYFLRGFTNLRRNFGDEGLFTKPFLVLNILDKIDPSEQKAPVDEPSFKIVANKPEYQTRDEIKLSFDLRDRDGNPVASDLSVSVTDGAQVIAVPESTSIIRDFPIKGEGIGKIDELKYRIERGVSFYAQFLNNRGKGERTQLSFVQWKTGDVMSAQTGDDGSFWQTGLQFTDSATFSYKSDKATGSPYGKVKILPREIPKLQIPESLPELRVIKSNTIQRIISEYEVPKDRHLLETVEVRATRINSTDVGNTKRRTYGRADHVLTAKNLNLAYPNLLLSLVGKVPGLQVNPTTGSIYFSRAGSSSLTLPTGPMVTINDAPISGDAGTILQTIDPSVVESIEFTSRLNVLYGAQGTFGVISVYTKSGASVDATDPNFQTVKLPGFSKSRKFIGPDYSNPQTDATQTDFRATIYWNPDVATDNTGAASVSFFASDLPGLYHVVVEGVTQQGVPVRSETYIKVEEKR